MSQITLFDDGTHKNILLEDFDAALKAWVKMVRPLDIETIAPQHGAQFQGKEMVGRFLDWLETLECGVDALPDLFKLPA
jgi:flavorubredoxin